MAVTKEKFTINSLGFNDAVDILPKVRRILQNSNIERGLLNIYANSKTSAVFVGDFEDFSKLNNFFDKSIKSTDNTAGAEFYKLILNYKSYFFKSSLLLPVENSDILINNQDGIYFIDFENDRKAKEIIVSIIN